jgi:hypothetical protein
MNLILETDLPNLFYRGEVRDLYKIGDALFEVTAHLCKDELYKLFDYSYYLKYIDHTFERLGLEERKPTMA